MLLHADTVEEGSTLEADLCIVGSGAAGLTLALDFVNGPVRVCLLESGGLDFDGDTQDLYDGEIAGSRSSPLGIDRLRFFGGTTNHWTGTSRPFDPIDFEPRPYVANSGWPFRFDEMAPYYESASHVCQIKVPFEGGEPDAYEPLNLESPWINARHFFRLNSLRFAKAYGDDIMGASNISVVLHANVIDIETTETAAEVTRLKVGTLQGRRFWVKSRIYVLATGGLENARLLLNSSSVEPNGLGNRYDVVGRYFQDHPGVDSGHVVFTSYDPSIPFYLNRTNENAIGRHGIFWPTPEAQRRWEMLNCAMWLVPIEVIQSAPAVASLKHILKSVGKSRVPDEFGQHVMRVVAGLDEVFASAYRKAFRIGPLVYTTGYWSESPPDPDSRVTLTDARDALGLRRIRLDWRIPEAYVRTYRIMHELLGRELGRAGIGRLQVLYLEPGEDPREHTGSSAHHMGTTRMHVDPRKGVVDANCRVHGIENLYIAGSSVFPTYSHSAATLTIVALALRLGRHLKQFFV